MVIRGRYSPKSSKTLGKTQNWFIEEATAADVAAGRAKAEGDLIIRHRTGGVKREFEA